MFPSAGRDNLCSHQNGGQGQQAHRRDPSLLSHPVGHVGDHCVPDESADEIKIAAIEDGELGIWECFAILEYLPYPKAYDLALTLWENDNDDDMDSDEIAKIDIQGPLSKNVMKKVIDPSFMDAIKKVLWIPEIIM